MLLALLAAGLSLFGHASTKGAAIERHRFDKWTYEIATDRFTGGKSCVVRRGDVSLVNGVVTFRFKPDLDTAAAWYRLDDAVARPVSDYTLELRRAGAPPVASDDLANPSGGLVRLPFSAMKSASKIAIRIDERRSARTFKLAGLALAASASAAKGCDPAGAR